VITDVIDVGAGVIYGTVSSTAPLSRNLYIRTTSPIAGLWYVFHVCRQPIADSSILKLFWTIEGQNNRVYGQVWWLASKRYARDIFWWVIRNKNVWQSNTFSWNKILHSCWRWLVSYQKRIHGVPWSPIECDCKVCHPPFQRRNSCVKLGNILNCPFS